MKDSFKRSWWKLPVFCLAAGGVSFLLMAELLGRFALITLEDGSLSHNYDLWWKLSGIPLLLTLLAGWLLFRKTPRRDLLCSAACTAALLAAFQLLSLLQISSFVWFSGLLTYWADFLCARLLRLIPVPWLYMALTWALPFLFVPFGRKIPD